MKANMRQPKLVKLKPLFARVPAGATGFTLLEVLVSVTILAIAFTTLFRLFGGSLRTIVDSEKYAHATVLAEQEMNDFLFDGELAGGTTEGTFKENSRYSWKRTVERYNNDVGRVNDDASTINIFGNPIIYKIHIDVSWKEGNGVKVVQLETLKTIVEHAQ